MIKSYKNDDTIEITNFELKSGLGEHFGSQMHRATIEFRSDKYSLNETLNVVIKVKPSDPNLEQVVAAGPLFETEIEAYLRVIPAMNRLYERSGRKIDFAPELIYAANEPNMVIILKDLTPDGYSVYRVPPNDLDDSKKMIQRLAQFHAASMQLEDNNELDTTKFTYSIYDTEHILDLFFRDTIKAFSEVVAEWSDFDEYLPKLEKLIKDIGVIGKRCYTPNAKGCGGFNVLNHGDLHLRNVLIKANADKKIESFYLLDYQLNVWCSPTVDLTYVMGLVKFDDKTDVNLKAELIVFYHQELLSALKSIGYMKTPPTLLDLNVELLRHGAMNITLWINFFPFLFVNWETMSIEEMLGVDSEKSRNFKKSLYNSPVLKSMLQREMKSWMLKGWW